MTHQQDTNWSKVPKGTLVEVLCDSVNGGWRPTYYHSFKPGIELCHRTQDSLGHRVGSAMYCRLYEGPGVLVWRDWKGGKECPVPEGKLCIIYDASIVNGFQVCTREAFSHWIDDGCDGNIMKYAIIEPPVEVGNE